MSDSNRQSTQKNLGEKMHNYFSIYCQVSGRNAESVADELGITRQALYRWFKGERKLSPQRLKNFCEVIRLNQEGCIDLFNIAGYLDKVDPNSEDINAADQEISEILQECMYNGEHLDFIAVVRKGRIVYKIHRDFATRLKTIGEDSVPTQISEYKSMTLQMQKIIDDLDAIFKHIDQGKLIRVIFDVRMGGVFFYYITEKIYMVAATVKQFEVDDGTAEIQAKAALVKVRQFLELY
jgi:transcriptional regulator with XRE-family HTH domain